MWKVVTDDDDYSDDGTKNNHIWSYTHTQTYKHTYTLWCNVAAPELHHFQEMYFQNSVSNLGNLQVGSEAEHGI